MELDSCYTKSTYHKRRRTLSSRNGIHIGFGTCDKCWCSIVIYHWLAWFPRRCLITVVWRTRGRSRRTRAIPQVVDAARRLSTSGFRVNVQDGHMHTHTHKHTHTRRQVCARRCTVSTQVCGRVAAGGLALRAVALWLPLRTCHWKWRTRRRVPPPCATSNWVGTSPSDPPSPLLSCIQPFAPPPYTVLPVSRRTHRVSPILYVTYTCPFSNEIHVLPSVCRPRSRLVWRLPTLSRSPSTWGGTFLPPRLKFVTRAPNIAAFEAAAPASATCAPSSLSFWPATLLREVVSRRV